MWRYGRPRARRPGGGRRGRPRAGPRSPASRSPSHHSAWPWPSSASASPGAVASCAAKTSRAPVQSARVKHSHPSLRSVGARSGSGMAAERTPAGVGVRRGLPPRSRCAAARPGRRIVGMPASRPRRTLLLVALFVVLAGAIGGPLAGALDSSDGFVPPGADSEVAVERIQAATGRDPGLGPRRCSWRRRPMRTRSSSRLAALPGIAEAGSPRPGLVTAQLARLRRRRRGRGSGARQRSPDTPGVTVGGPAVAGLPDRRDGRRGPRPRRADRVPVPARALAALLPRPRDAAAARGRDHDRARDVPRAHRRQRRSSASACSRSTW